MAFRDLDEFFDDTLSLPIGGRVYVVPSPSAETGLLCQRLMEVGVAAARGEATGDASNLDDAAEVDLYQRVLGSAYEQMQAHGVSWQKIKHAGITAFLWIAGDKSTAEKYWETGASADPEASAPAGATKPVAAKSTRTRVSGTGTTRKTSRATTASRGKTS